MNRKHYVRVSEIISFHTNYGKCITCGNSKHQIPQEVLDRKCRIGTNVHEIIEMHLKNMEQPPDDENARGYFESFKLWNEEAQIEPLVQEIRLYNDDLMITGQIDCLGNMKGKKEVLLDFKTSSKPDKFAWRMQAAFYYMLAKDHWEVSNEVIFIHLMKDGKIAKEVIFHINNEILQDALALYRVFKIKNGDRFF